MNAIARALRRLAFAPLLLGAVHAADPEKPNILWLIAEDFGQHLGCYGTPEVHTPNLDRLAADGERFTRCFTTAPVCSAARSAFMTGMYQTTIGAHQHRTPGKDKKPLPDGVKLVTDWLRGAGYHTANIRQFPPAVGFKGTGKTDFNFKYPGQPFDTARWNDLKSHQPFYAQVNFHETHRNFNGPQVADPAKVEIPPYYPDHPVVRKDWARYLDAASELDRKVGLILDQLEKDGLADNTIVVFFGDHGQAHVRGKQFCYDSGLLVPLIIRYPDKLKAPAGYQPHSVSDRLLEATDLTAQTLDWAGVKRPEAMQGRVFMGDRADPPRELAFGARDRCDETVFRFRTARDARYRYIRNFTPDRPLMLRNDYKAQQYPAWNLIKWLGREGKLTNDAQRFLVAPTMPEEELYDTLADPHETLNLATSPDPEHQAALKRLRGAVEKWIVDTRDAGVHDDTRYDKKRAAEGDKIGPQYDK
ncbi:sulfatase family protein [Luteolibacter marinus]|uniref:sulfatase family protein n=1 Tax=Luteolibacter marinus TaxID=2776705 RepID=UPI00186826AE|nr:sulfatase [Luteolibacter marinus]